MNESQTSTDYVEIDMIQVSWGTLQKWSLI
jgi:hypothetical protein